MSHLFRNILYFSTALSLNHGAARAESQGSSYIVHEWGTFTALQGSDGSNQEGMHHEEERLPSFVVGRCGTGVVHGDAKCADFEPLAKSPLAVTQKMETPVIYFYGDKESTAEVTVRFPKGVISQWYPAATAFIPRIGQVSKLEDSSMTWQVDIKAPNYLLSNKVPKGESWLHARDVDANVVLMGQSAEKFIFYRGLGQFETDFRIESDETGKISFLNRSDDSIPAVFLLGFDGQKGFIHSLGTVSGQGSPSLPEIPPYVLDTAGYLQQAQGLVKKSLIDSGLYPKEAQGMVKTWEKSYFLTPGLRVLYILPRQWSDQLLPLDIKPEPKETIRTMVGRIEVMTYQEEKTALSLLTLALAKNQSFDMTPWGRLKEAKLRRLLSLSQDAKLKNAIDIALNKDTCTAFPCL